MEKYDSADEFDIVWNEDVVETNTTTADDDDEFVKSILGQPYEPVQKHSESTPPRRDSEEFPDSQATLQQIRDKYHAPYVTPGGKQIKVVKDDWGTFWHAKFVGGGELPAELSGAFTNEQEADNAIRIYLARKE